MLKTKLIECMLSQCEKNNQLLTFSIVNFIHETRNNMSVFKVEIVVWAKDVGRNDGGVTAFVLNKVSPD